MCSQFKRTAWKATSLAMMLSLVGFTMALAAAGDLDTTFSGDGKQTTDFAGQWLDEMHAMALQADGKIVAVGERWDPANLEASTHDFALARYKTNGSLDASFSGDGKQLTNFGAVDRAMGVAIQSDGKIVVSGQKCGASACDLAVVRYKSNGSLDTTFSGDGKALVAFGSGDNGTSGGLAIQPNGKIVIGGYMVNASGNDDFAVYRLNPNGSPDTTFSGDGKVSFGFGVGRQDDVIDLALQGSNIVVVGSTANAAWTHGAFALARLTSAGVLDPTFSGDGKQTTDFGVEEGAESVALEPGGKILLAGTKYNGTTNYFALARYTSSGALDTTFSGDGRQVFGFGSYSWAEDVLVQSNGKIVVAGNALNGTVQDFALARLNDDGSLDTTFSTDGKAAIDFPCHYAVLYALARQADGKYVLGGSSCPPANDFALARVLP